MEENKQGKVILVGLDMNIKEDFEHSMAEMEALVEACDLTVAASMVQRLPHPEAGTYLGSGKADELATIVESLGAEICVFEGNLTPAQQKNLQRIVNVNVWDRTNLILEIFKRRAKTREAKLQVESAYLQYMLPRLSGMWQHLGRQGGGSGGLSNRGIGETQLELDRRHIKQRISELSRELDSISKTRETQRQGRKKGQLPLAAMVGYTNAGKSTLMNRLLILGDREEEKQVFQKDMLFATLDTSIRRIATEDNMDFLLSDTVGFIEDLPHDLVKAFRSTLEEAVNADLLLVVLDASDDYWMQHKKVAEDTLKTLKADKIPRLYVMNKADMMDNIKVGSSNEHEGIVYISAATGEGIDVLMDMIRSRLYQDSKNMTLLLPYSEGNLLSRLHENAGIISEEYEPEGVKVTANCPGYMHKELEPYVKHIIS